MASSSNGTNGARPPGDKEGNADDTRDEDEEMPQEGGNEDTNKEALNEEATKILGKLKFGKSEIQAKVSTLGETREQLKKEPRTATTELRSARRRESRLKNKAAKMDNNGLLEIFRIRAEAKAKAIAKAKAAA